MRLCAAIAAGLLPVSCSSIALKTRCQSSRQCAESEVCERGFCVAAAGLVIVTEALAPARVGSAYSARLEARGGRGPVSFALGAGAGLPMGLWLEPDGMVTGKPMQGGSSRFRVQAVDASAALAEKELALVVEPRSGSALRITTLSLPEGAAGSPYQATIEAEGGSPPYVFTLAGGIVPPHLTLSPTGELSGTPTAGGTSHVTIQVRDASSSPQLATANFALAVRPDSGAALSAANLALRAGSVGAPYTAFLEATGGRAPYDWALSGGTSLPSGLWLHGSGVIAGTPTQAGTSTFLVQVMDASERRQVATVQLSIAVDDESLTLVSSALPNGQVGQPYSAVLSASGGQTPFAFSVASGRLPSMLELLPSGVIAGTPTSAGTFHFSIQATDASSAPQVTTRPFSITVLAGADPPLAVSTTLPTGALGLAYDAQLLASGGGAPFAWSLDDRSSLPPGLSLSSTGAITGMPSTIGRFTFTVLAVDSSMQKLASSALSLAIDGSPENPTVTTANLPNATVGVAYSQPLQARGGMTPYTWTIAAGSMPPGIAFSADGLLSGTPTMAGTFHFTAQVADASNAQRVAQKSFTLPVHEAPDGPAVAAASLDPATAGRPYRSQLEARGGTAPYRFRLDSGELPDGLALSANGALAGTPNAAGSYAFAIEVVDAGGRTAFRQCHLTVLADPKSALLIATGALTNGVVGQSYRSAISASGGTPPYTFSMASGALPPGLSLESSGVLSGMPATSGDFTFTVRVTDSSSPVLTADRSFRLAIAAGAGQMMVTTQGLPQGKVGVVYDAMLTAAGGSPPYRWSLVSGMLPAGLSLSSSGSITGTPMTAGSSTFTIRVADASVPAKSAARQLSIAVRP